MARPKSTSRDVATVRHCQDLLVAVGAPRLKPEQAFEKGLLARQKVEGVWIYAVDDELIEAARHEMEALSIAAAHEAFIGHINHLAGRARKGVSCNLQPHAAQQLFKLHIRRGVLGGLGQLSQYYDPYLVAFAEDERHEVDRMLADALDRLATEGAVEVEELPSTAPRSFDGWQEAILRHLEFQGHGWMEYGRLVGGRP